MGGKSGGLKVGKGGRVIGRKIGAGLMVGKRGTVKGGKMGEE